MSLKTRVKDVQASAEANAGGPARLQVDPDTIPDDDKPAQSGSVFNIWYLKWSGGGDSSSKSNYTKSKFRTNIKKDSGYTRARPGSSICLFFSRGCCYLGKKCPYYHRIPIDSDYFKPTQDCFGRDKTSEYRDDMDGVGSFNRSNRTLYVGGLNVTDKTESIVTKHFAEFGQIEKIRVLHGKSCAFITYRLESQAQFAKEAMQNQSLDANEVLNIRWANEDPNPQAQKQEKRRMEEIALETVKKLLAKVEDQKPKIKKQKVEVEEPEEEDVEEVEVDIKKIEPVPLSTSSSSPRNFFDNSTLDKLALSRSVMAAKAQVNKKQLHEEKQKAVSALVGGYESSEDEE
ncbi:hypothetical protein G9P44_000883 [Scheffersomyces stipitis]|nr:hypothetical protein G9P44_000883 [Scheffersomyces stipitis]